MNGDKIIPPDYQTIVDIINSHTGNITSADLHSIYTNSGIYTITYVSTYADLKLSKAPEIVLVEK